jgi:hypothetical protein
MPSGVKNPTRNATATSAPKTYDRKRGERRMKSTQAVYPETQRKSLQFA